MLEDHGKDGKIKNAMTFNKTDPVYVHDEEDTHSEMFIAISCNYHCRHCYIDVYLKASY
jgi:MoaA/NifB/PqqE/SkfB family radical SAM enzyme